MVGQRLHSTRKEEGFARLHKRGHPVKYHAQIYCRLVLPRNTYHRCEGDRPIIMKNIYLGQPSNVAHTGSGRRVIFLQYSMAELQHEDRFEPSTEPIILPVPCSRVGMVYIVASLVLLKVDAQYRSRFANGSQTHTRFSGKKTVLGRFRNSP